MNEKIAILFENSEYFVFICRSYYDTESSPVIIDKNQILRVEDGDAFVVGYFFYERMRQIYSGSAIEKEITNWLKNNRPGWKE